MESAVAVVNRLVDAGFSRNDISVIANDRDNQYKGYLDRDGETDDVAKGAGIGAAIGGLGGLLVGLGALAIPGIGPVIAAGPIAAALAGAGIGAVAGGVIGALVDLGIPEDEAHLYAESVRRGNVLVAAQVSDNRADEASRIMDSAGLIDLDRQAEDWRASGWTGFQAQGGSYQGNGQSNKPRGEDIAYNQTARNTHTQSTSQRHDNLTDGDDTIEVVEEDIRIGKRNVQEGGVRVRSYVREVPVEEEVRLREERVHVDRRPVDRPATAQDLNSFREGTVEIRESHEEPVISKEARVVEEVHIHKDVEEHTERVRDTARRTEVEVEEINQSDRGRSRTGNGYGTYDMYDPDFRTHFQTAYATSGAGFEVYQPAYRYGYTLATDDRYRDRNWREIEPEVRRAWETRNQGTWENFKDAIQHSWNQVRGRA
jgi:uncharacterized protein (TIGR02271 family)